MTFRWHFVDWCCETDRLCQVHLGCTWAELAGDPEPLAAAFIDHETPAEFVIRQHQKFGLQWLTPLDSDRLS